MAAKTITPHQALERLTTYCTRYETCSWKVLQKLQQWQIDKAEQNTIMQYLVSRQFIDDARYAHSFVRSKWQGSRWGMQKIKFHLQRQGLDSDIIAQALQEIDSDGESDALEQLLRKKLPYVKAPSNSAKQAKLLRFAIGRGYGYAIAADAVKKALENNTEN